MHAWLAFCSYHIRSTDTPRPKTHSPVPRTCSSPCTDALDVGGNLISSAADLVPDSVPRGVAKGGVAVVGVLAVFWVLQKVSWSVRVCVGVRRWPECVSVLERMVWCHV